MLLLHLSRLHQGLSSRAVQREQPTRSPAHVGSQRGVHDETNEDNAGGEDK